MKLRRPRQHAVYQPIAGDILVFDAAGGIISGGIKLITCSSHTHVALCADIHGYDVAVHAKMKPWPICEAEVKTWRPRVLVFESTTLTPEPCIFQKRQFKGVQAHEVQRRVDGYDGDVWMMRLKQPLCELESQALALALLGFVGTPYDDRGAVLSATRWLKHGIRNGRASDRSTLFCCEVLLAALDFALNKARKYKQVNAGTLSPAGVVRGARQLYAPEVLIKPRQAA